MKITFLGAGSTVFARNVIGDCLCSDVLKDSEFALYDIDGTRLEESYSILNKILKGTHNARFTKYLGVENRKAALKGADFVVNAIAVGGYKPCTVTDFEIPAKYGLSQTIGDTVGIGGIMRALRTIPVIEDFMRDIEEVCPDAWFLNYSNPMAMLTGYVGQYHKGVKSVGLCHSVQICSKRVLTGLGMEDKIDGVRDLVAGINHMAWLLEIKDKDGNDLYPEIRKRATEILEGKREATELSVSGKLAKDMIKYEYIIRLGYFCTESSIHHAEYNPFFIKSKYPELLDRYGINIGEYLWRCERQINGWKEMYGELSSVDSLPHERSKEYASRIMESMVTNTPYQIGGNVQNNGLITNLPPKACVEVPCLVNGHGITPCFIGDLPTQLAAMNLTNINVQLLTVEAARERSREKIYQAAMLDPHTAAELSIDDIVSMCDEMIEAHGEYMKMY